MFSEIITQINTPIQIGDMKVILQKDKTYIIPSFWNNQLTNPSNTVKKYKISNHLDLSKIDSLDGKKILFIRTYAYGDLIMLTGVINYIRDRFKSDNITIDFAIAKNHHSLISRYYNHIIDNPIEVPIEKDIIDQYDNIVTISGLIENNETNQSRNIYDVFYHHIGIDSSLVERQYKQPAPFKDIKYSPYSNIIGIHPFSGSLSRSYNIHTIFELCKRLNDKHIYIFSNLEQYNNTKPLFDRLDNVVFPISQNADISHSIKCLSECDWVLCTDSSILHLCQSIGVKTKVIFGSINWQARCLYYDNIIIKDTNPSCRCYTHSERCPKSFQYPPCINLDIDWVINNNIITPKLEDKQILKFNQESLNVKKEDS